MLICVVGLVDEIAIAVVAQCMKWLVVWLFTYCGFRSLGCVPYKIEPLRPTMKDHYFNAIVLEF